ncbi:MAG: putative LPS assembly protein LptD [Saprospiraceae bacterium]
MKAIFTLLFLSWGAWWVGSNLYAQNPSLAQDTIPVSPAADSTRTDTSSVSVADSLFYKVTFSNDSLSEPVNTGARDSIIYDIKNRKIYLYGAAEVTYTTIKLNADYIVFDWESNIVTASGLPDSTGKKVGLPKFADGEQDFTADSMRYNFKTRKGIVYDVTTEESGVVIHGARSKFISQQPAPGDTTSKTQNIIYSKGAIFTTCTAEHPHFGIRSQKQKVVPDKLAVVGPSNLEIMGVPTPLWLPFGFFPLSKGRRTGLMFPRDYEYSPQWGFGLRDIGWYFPLGQNFNLTLTSNVYLKGRWGVSANSQYRKRYKYSGNLQISFEQFRNEDNEGNIQRPRSFLFTWSHRQDAAAHPSNNFGGTINFQTNGFRQRAYNDAANVLQSQQINSNFGFTKNWQDKPLSFSATFNHSQNQRDSSITISFPNLQFQTQTLYPFRRKERSGEEKWFETITLRYTSEARNTFRTKDSLFLTQEMFRNAEYGVQQTATSGTSFKLFKYFNLNPSVDYREVWYFNKIEKDFDPTLTIVYDTIPNADTTEFTIVPVDTTRFGEITNLRRPGFASWRAFSASVSLNTQLFGTLQFRKGFLRGLRHVAKISTGLSFSPDYLNPRLQYFNFVQTSILLPDQQDFQRYSVFEQGIYGAPPAQGQQMAINYSINNIFEAKVRSKRDTVDRKVKLFDNLYVNGFYNFSADTMQWSQVSISGTTRLLKDITTVGFLMQLDPYIVESNGRGSFVRVNKTALREQGRLLRLDNANLRFNTNLTVGKLRELFTGQEREVVEDLRQQPQQRRTAAEEDFLSLFENFNIDHNFVMGWNTDFRTGRDTFQVSVHSLNTSGTIQLSKNWRINVGNIGYDFIRKDFSYPSVGFTRDLHCWEMGMNWQPTRGTYSFYIQVKPGTFDFLRLPYERNNADAIRAFQ